MISWQAINKGYCEGFLNGKVEYVIFGTNYQVGNGVVQLYASIDDTLKVIERCNYHSFNIEYAVNTLKDVAIEHYIQKRRVKIINILKDI
jgi:hypothetical protein